MPVGIQGVRNWQTWRTDITAADTFITEFKPADYDSTKGISVHPFTAIVVLPLGVGDDGDGLDMRITGFMTAAIKGGSGPGPGMPLVHATLTLGAVGAASWLPVSENTAGPLWTARAWDFFKEYSSTGKYEVSGFVEHPTAVLNQRAFIMPTMGFTNLMLEVDTFTGASAITFFGMLWRGVSKEGAI